MTTRWRCIMVAMLCCLEGRCRSRAMFVALTVVLLPS
jgi:hypothetical protein